MKTGWDAMYERNNESLKKKKKAMLRKTFTVVQMKNYFHNMQRTLDQISNEYLSRNREMGRGHERELKS